MRFEGFAEFEAELRALPTDLAAEAGEIVENAAEEAYAAIKVGYPKVTGNLADGLEVEHQTTAFGAVSIVRNRAKHAFIYENGTQARHYFTDAGVRKDVGRMLPGHVFVPIAIRKRREMREKLIALVQGKGLRVDDAA